MKYIKKFILLTYAVLYRDALYTTIMDKRRGYTRTELPYRYFRFKLFSTYKKIREL